MQNYVDIDKFQKNNFQGFGIYISWHKGLKNSKLYVKGQHITC